MKALKFLYISLFACVVFAGCSKIKNEDVSFVEKAPAPAALSAMFDITQDNSGLVTITPSGEGLAYFNVYYGDATATPVRVNPGGSTQHKYAEGIYNVRVVGVGVTGKTTEATKALTVSFRAPEAMEVTLTADPANAFKYSVSAKALYETVFRVYFGDVANEVPVSFLEGETVSRLYVTPGTYTIRVVALSGGAATTTVTKTITIYLPVVLPLDFETVGQTYNFNNFDGGGTTVIANPKPGTINTSGKVAKMVKSGGQPWGGSVISLATPIDFSANKVFRMKVYSPRVGAKVLLKVENASNGGISFEKEVATTVANAWEDMVFDYRTINTANAYQNIVLIFDNGTMGDGSANFTFYLDDIRLTNTIPTAQKTQINLPVTFDNDTVDYTVIDFGNNSTIDALDPTNAANKVKKTTKTNGAETWAGTTIGTALGFINPIALSPTASQMTVRVYSPAAGLPIRLKIEDHTNPTISVETEAKTTVANAWETLNFDFVNQASGTAVINYSSKYNKASIFFDFNTVGNGKVFYWDDVIKLTQNYVAPPAAGLGLPLDFESTTLAYDYNNFDGGNASVVNNPYSGANNTSAKVGKMIKGGGQPWGGSWIGLANPIDFSTKKTFKVKVYSPRVGAKLLLKVENQTDGGISFEKEAVTTVANAWEVLTFDYSAIPLAGKTYQKIVMIFDLGTMGDGSANFTFYFDDITLN